MNRFQGAMAVLGVLATTVGAGWGNEPSAPSLRQEAGARSCSLRNTEGLYGFNCTGFFPPTTPGAATLQPIGFVGFIRGDGLGRFSGPATVSLDFGSLPARLGGTATLDPARECLGRVVYDTFEIEFAPGFWQNVGPSTFDFAVVADGDEIFGSATAPGGTGSAVPRMACHLKKVHRGN